MFRFKLRTLLILLAILPPLLAVVLPPLLERQAPAPLPPSAPPAKPTPYFENYATGNADPNATYQVLTKMLAGTPNLRMSLDSRSGNIAVLASPSVHATIEQVIANLQAASPPAKLK